ncbi:sirohydrochlorin chelatase [Oculatella sp. FACHB-28]|uniref:sirohydrochlorin chelatase n=1 Tax=Oculatella sp. FACHB-28 TaxID=2692845 RepID=UPI0016851D30|nr:sirohydrochlorin chelatase [Oculatella sp. FACHB-28]MBD2057712.1 sirohydrochlorin chelatase [Oculatella sp. FACHB-28]
MNFSTAYLLVSHGSRDPRPQVAIEELARLIRDRLAAEIPVPEELQTTPLRLPFGKARLQAPRRPAQRVMESSPLVGTAVLELAPLPLHQQIQRFGDRARAAGYGQVKILPLFLLPGVHVMEDVPAELAIAQAALGESIRLSLCTHLGSHPRLRTLLTLSADTPPEVAKVIISHGSRRPGGNQPVEAIAQHMGAAPAYWSVSPSLDSQVAALVETGNQVIAILPYFLFAGGITDAIAQHLPHLAQRFPHIHLYLEDPIGANAELADIAIELLLA